MQKLGPGLGRASGSARQGRPSPGLYPRPAHQHGPGMARAHPSPSAMSPTACCIFSSRFSTQIRGLEPSRSHLLAFGGRNAKKKPLQSKATKKTNSACLLTAFLILGDPWKLQSPLTHPNFKRPRNALLGFGKRCSLSHSNHICQNSCHAELQSTSDGGPTTERRSRRCSTDRPCWFAEQMKLLKLLTPRASELQ